MYKKNKGNAGLEGAEFQLNLLTVFLLNALHGRKNWKISTENQEAGKYDDVVLELPHKSILLQAKSKQNKKINKNQLFSCNSKNADFSLPKYFFSYLEIQSAFIEKTVIICTNTNIDERDLEDCLTYNSVPPDSMLHYEGTSSSFFTFNDNILAELKATAEIYLDTNLRGKEFDKTVITDENIKDFLKHLQFFTNYPSGDNLDTIIGQLLARLNSSNLYQGISSLELYKKIKDWFKQLKGEYLTEERAKAMFSEIKSDKFCEELKKYNVSLRCNEFNFTDPRRMFVINSKGRFLLQALQIYDGLQKIEGRKLYVGPYEDVEVEKQIIESFTFSRYSFLIIIGSKITNGIATKEISNKLKEILEKYSYKKVILVSDCSEKLSQQIEPQDIVHIEGSVTFADLSDDCQRELVTARNIIFQGDKINLDELLINCTSGGSAEAVNSEILEELIRKNTIIVGMLPAGLNEDNSRYYVHRSFKREIHKGKDTQDKKKLNEETRLKTMTFDFDVNYHNKSEEEIFLEATICDVKEDVVLIADSAGMGKSTVLANLTTSIKKKYPHLWVIRIELADYSDILRDFIKHGEESLSILKLLDSKISTKMTNYLERFVFSMNKKVVLLLDGIDEISPDYTQLIFNCLTQCLQSCNFAKLFVTTRQHMVLELEAVLNVKPFILQPFTEQNQIDFLTRYWAYNLIVDQEIKGKCEEYARTLISRMSSWTETYDYNDITAIPLQLRMLAEIFQESIKWNESSDWEGCKDYLMGTTDVPNLPERMEIKTLYDMFVEKKRDIYIHKGNSSGNSEANKVLMEHFDESLITHRRFALELILPEEDCPLFSCYRRTCKDMGESILKIGIIQRSNHEVNFIHRTFAEYFVTESLVAEIELQLYSPNLKIQQFLIDKIFQLSEYKVIRIFLDSFLHRVKHSIPPKFFHDYKSRIGYLLQPENEYGLIHLLASEGCVAILQLILKCLNVKVIKNKEVNTTDLRNRFFGNMFQFFKRKTNILSVLQVFIREGGISIKNMFGRTPLHEAAEKGHSEMVRFLVEHGAIINSLDNEGDTALHFAALTGRSDIVKFLAECGSDINIIDKSGCTALHFALAKGHFHLVEYLAEPHDNINVKYNEGKTALHVAAANGHLYTVKFLIERGVDVNTEDMNGMTALHVAAARGQLAVIEYLMKLSENVNIQDVTGRTALHLAAAYGNLDSTKSLLELGVDASIEDNAGRTAFYFAARYGHLHIVKFLFKKGVHIYIEDVRIREALHLSAENGYLGTVQYLLEQDVNVQIRNVRSKVALCSAIANGHLHIIKFLEHYVHPNVKEIEYRLAFYLAVANDHLSTAKYLLEQDVECEAILHFAAADGRLETIKFLLEQGVDVNFRESEGNTVLHLAVVNSHFYTVKFLLQTDIFVNAKNIGGNTALHLAVANDRLDIVKVLMKGRPEVYVRNTEGKTALDLAVGNGNLDIVKFLIERSAVSVGNVGRKTLLHLAAENGHLKTVKYLLERDADVNVRNDSSKMHMNIV